MLESPAPFSTTRYLLTLLQRLEPDSLPFGPSLLGAAPEVEAPAHLTARPDADRCGKQKSWRDGTSARTYPKRKARARNGNCPAGPK
eukprot:scaffold26284_cov84-Isochrysis_galbana.AAC.1